MAKEDEMVVDGASVKCTMGDKSAQLKVTSNFTYKIDGKPVATMMDFTPANFMPPVATFGTCKPYKAVPPPGCLCTVIPAGPWVNPFAKKLIGGKPALKGDGKLICARAGGMITFDNSGQ